MTYEIEIFNPIGLDRAMTAQIDELWYTRESFKKTYGQEQLLETIVFSKFISEFEELSKNSHYSDEESKIGLLSELLVKHIIGGNLSENLYDTEKDITQLDDKIAEVKLCVFFQKTNQLYIQDNKSETTLTKLKNVDVVYFIERKVDSIVIHKSENIDGNKGRWGNLYFDLSVFTSSIEIKNKKIHSLFMNNSPKNFNKDYMRS